MFEIEPVLCLRDNYAWILSDPDESICAVVDPSEAEPVRKALNARGLKLTHILNTHHHPDHVGGNLALKADYGATIVGPGKDAARIPRHRCGCDRGRNLCRRQPFRENI
jgi:hydroxyacylglutathione hydrolase